MTSRLLACLVFAATLGLAAAEAQVPGYNSKQFRIEQIDEGHWRFTGQVELENEETAGQKFYANVVDLYTDDDRVEASGNVVYETATARVAAERAVFFTRAGTGTFYNASGLASLGEKADRSMFGALEPDVYFYGEILEKTGEDRYKITKGGFTTCVQPTPRWELVSGSARINVGDYALLSNAVMRVKDVPIFYLPWMYYPIQDDDRSTGFLLPSYGRSLYQGSSVSNAFFWAMTRSQDLTVMHDWFTQTGQGYGTEYRWMRSAHQPRQPARLQAGAEGGHGERRASARIAQRAGERGDHPGPAAPAQRPGPHRLLVQSDAQPALQPGHLQRHAEPEHLERQRLGVVAVPQRVGDRPAHAAVLQRDPVADQRIAAQHHRRGVEPQAGAASGLLRAAVGGGAADLHRSQRRHRPRSKPDRGPTSCPACACRSADGRS